MISFELPSTKGVKASQSQATTPVQGQDAERADASPIDFSVPPIDRLRTYLKKIGLFDDAWNVTLDKTGEPLLALTAPQLQRLDFLLITPIDVVSKDKQHSFSIRLDDLILKLTRDRKLPAIESIEIIGGAVFWILGKEYIERAIKSLGGDLSEVLFESEIEAFFVKPPDLDLRLNIIPRNVRPFKEWLEGYFWGKLSQGENCQAKIQALLAGEFLKPKLIELSDTFLAALLFGNQNDFKVDMIFAAALPRKYLYLPDDVRLPIHKINALTIEMLLTSHFTGYQLMPTGEIERGWHGLVTRLGKVAPIAFNDQLDTINDAGAFSLATLATKGYLLPSQQSIAFLCRKIATSCAGNIDEALREISKAIDNHFAGQPLAAVSYCLNLYNIMHSSGIAVNTLNTLHQAIYLNGIFTPTSPLNEGSPALNILFAWITTSMPVDVLLAFLKLLSGLLGQQNCLGNHKTFSFSSSLDEKLTIKLQDNNKSYTVALQSDLPEALSAFQNHFSKVCPDEKNAFLDLCRSFCDELLKAQPFEVTSASNNDLIDMASNLLTTPLHPFLGEMPLLLLCRYGYLQRKQIELTPFLCILNIAVTTEGNGTFRQQLFNAFLQGLIKSPHNEKVTPFLTLLENFSLYISRKEQHEGDIARYWCNLLAKIPHPAFQRLAYRVWKKGMLSDQEGYDDRRKLEAFLKNLASHSPHLALKAISLAHEASLDEAALIPCLQQLFQGYRALSDLREALAVLPLLARIAAKMIAVSNNKAQIATPDDIVWLTSQLLTYASNEAMMLLEVAVPLLPNNALQKQQLEIYAKICGQIDPEKIAIKWPFLIIYLEKMAFLSNSTNDRAMTEGHIDKLFCYLLQSGDPDLWPHAEAFIEKLLTLPLWQVFYHNNNPGRVILLLDWHTSCELQVTSPASPTAIEKMIKLLLLGCKCKPLPPFNERLARATIKSLKAYNAIVKLLPSDLRTGFQELRAWLAASLQAHPLLLIDFFNIVKKQNGAKEIPPALLKSFFMALHDVLSNKTSITTSMNFVIQHLEAHRKAAQKSSSPNETLLRLKLIGQLITDDNIAKAISYLKAVIPCYCVDAKANGSAIYDNEAIAEQTLSCVDLLLDRSEWGQVQQLLSCFSAQHKNFTSLRFATAWQRLCSGVETINIDAAIPILIERQKLFACYALQPSLHDIASKCAKALLATKKNGKESFDIAVNYAIHEAKLWAALLETLLLNGENSILPAAIAMLGSLLKGNALSKTQELETAQCWHIFLKAAFEKCPAVIAELKLLDTPSDILELFIPFPELSQSIAYYFAMSALNDAQPRHDKAFALLRVVEDMMTFDKEQSHAINVAFVKCFSSAPSADCYLAAGQRLIKLFMDGQTSLKALKELLQQVAFNCTAIVDNAYELQLADLFSTLKALFMTADSNPSSPKFLIALLTSHPFGALQNIAYEIAVSILSNCSKLQLEKHMTSGDQILIPHAIFEKPLTDYSAKENRKLLFLPQACSFFNGKQLAAFRHKLILYYLDKALACADDPNIGAARCNTTLRIPISPINIFIKMKAGEQTQEVCIEESILKKEKWINEAQTLFLEHCHDADLMPLLLQEGFDRAINLALKLALEKDSVDFYGLLFALLSTQFSDAARLTSTFVQKVEDLNALGVAFNIDYENIMPFMVNTNWRHPPPSAAQSQSRHLHVTSKHQDTYFMGLVLLMQKMLSYPLCAQVDSPRAAEEIQLKSDKQLKMIHQHCFLNMSLLCHLYPKANDSLIEMIYEFAFCDIPIDMNFFVFHCAAIRKLLMAPNRNNLKKSSWIRILQINLSLDPEKIGHKTENAPSEIEESQTETEQLPQWFTSRSQNQLKRQGLAKTTFVENKAAVKRLQLKTKFSYKLTPETTFAKKIEAELSSKFSTSERHQICCELVQKLATKNHPIYLRIAIELMIGCQQEVQESNKLHVNCIEFYKWYQCVFDAVIPCPYIFMNGATQLDRIKALVEISCKTVDDSNNLRSCIMSGYIGMLYQIYAQHPTAQTPESMYRELYTQLLPQIQTGYFTKNLEDVAVFMDKLIPFAQRYMIASDDPAIAIVVLYEMTKLFCQADQCNRTLPDHGEHAKSVAGIFNAWLKVLFECGIPEIREHAIMNLECAISNGLYQHAEEELAQILVWSDF